MRLKEFLIIYRLEKIQLMLLNNTGQLM